MKAYPVFNPKKWILNKGILLVLPNGSAYYPLK